MVPFHLDLLFSILPPAPLPLSFQRRPVDETAGVKWLFHIQPARPQLEVADTTGTVRCQSCERGVQTYLGKTRTCTMNIQQNMRQAQVT